MKCYLICPRAGLRKRPPFDRLRVTKRVHRSPFDRLRVASGTFFLALSPFFLCALCGKKSGVLFTCKTLCETTC